jgi:hypothetical protein
MDSGQGMCFISEKPEYSVTRKGHNVPSKEGVLSSTEMSFQRLNIMIKLMFTVFINAQPTYLQSVKFLHGCEPPSLFVIKLVVGPTPPPSPTPPLGKYDPIMKSVHYMQRM